LLDGTARTVVHLGDCDALAVDRVDPCDVSDAADQRRFEHHDRVGLRIGHHGPPGRARLVVPRTGGYSQRGDVVAGVLVNLLLRAVGALADEVGHERVARAGRAHLARWC
jgi:hypothetical protein